MDVKISRDRAGRENLGAYERNAEIISLEFESGNDYVGIPDECSGLKILETFKSLEEFIQYVLSNPQLFRKAIENRDEMHLQIKVHENLNYVRLGSHRNKFTNLDVVVDVTDVLSGEYKKLSEKLGKIREIL